MRIDREKFLFAVSMLAGCERADAVQPAAVVVASPHGPHSDSPRTSPPAVAVARPTPLEVTPTPPPEPTPAPVAVPDDTPPAKPARPRPRVSAAKRWFLGLTMDQQGAVSSMCESEAMAKCWAALQQQMPKSERHHAVADVDQPPSPPTPPAAAPPVPAEPDPEPPDDPGARFIASLTTQQRALSEAYCREMPAPTCETPLVVAFERQPVEFVAASRDRFAFVPGVPMASDWPTAATPWIARDLDGDGAITSGAELFGSSTVVGGGETALNGFAALAELDRNRDGVIDARDPAFGELVLWSDRDGDRRSTSDELRPLASVITAIPLAHTLDPRCTTRGACEGERGTVRWRDDSGAEREGAVIDIYVPRR